MTHASAIKYQIELALPAKDKETLDLSSQSLHNHEVSPEKKALMKARTNVLCKITRQYHRLVNECFPSFLDKLTDLPKSETVSKITKVETGYSLNDFEENPIPDLEVLSITEGEEDEDDKDGISRLINDEVEDDLTMSIYPAIIHADPEDPAMPLYPNPFAQPVDVPEMERMVETNVDDDIPEVADDIVSINGVDYSMSQPEIAALGRINPIFLRSRFQNSTSTLPQDLFETPRNALELLDKHLEFLQGKTIFEPCCGGGAITDYLEVKGFKVISRDLYSTEEKHDYLKTEDPEYDILITNPVRDSIYEYLTT